MAKQQAGPALLVTSIILISISGNLGASLVPLAVGELIEPPLRGGAGFSIEQAGALQTMELVAIAIGSALSPAIRIQRRALLALLLAALLAVASIVVRGLELFALRLLAGLTVGVALGSAMARVGDTPDPERVYTWGTAANAVAAFLSLTAGGEIAMGFGLAGIFVLAAVTLVPGLIGALLLGEPAGSSMNSARADRRLSAGALLAVAALFLLNLAVAAAFTVLEPNAEAIGMDKGELGRALGLGPLAGLVAVLGFTYLVPRTYHGVATLALLAGTGLLVFPLIAPPSASILAFSIIVQTALYYAAIPPLMAIGTAAGPSERSAPVMSGAIVLGAALGPGIGGILHGGGLMSLLLGMMFTAAAIAVVIASRFVARNSV